MGGLTALSILGSWRLVLLKTLGCTLARGDDNEVDGVISDVARRKKRGGESV